MERKGNCDKRQTIKVVRRFDSWYTVVIRIEQRKRGSEYGQEAEARKTDRGQQQQEQAEGI